MENSGLWKSRTRVVCRFPLPEVRTTSLARGSQPTAVGWFLPFVLQGGFPEGVWRRVGLPSCLVWLAGH